MTTSEKIITLIVPTIEPAVSTYLQGYNTRAREGLRRFLTRCQNPKKKRLVSTPASRPASPSAVLVTVPLGAGGGVGLCCLHPIEPCVHLFSRFEIGPLLRGEQDRYPRAGIAALARRDHFHSKHPKPPQFDPLALDQGRGQALKDLVDDPLPLLAGELGYCVRTLSMSSRPVIVAPLPV